MNRQFTRIVAGLGIIAVGVLALLNALNINGISEFAGMWWPMAIIFAGVLMFINNPRQFVWPLIVIGAGTLWQLRELDMLTFNPWQLFWPIVIIAVGLSVLINRSHGFKNINKRDTDDITAILSGSSTKSESKDYKGGKMSAVMGGIEIDLRDAVIKTEATVDVFAFWGGISLKVPEGWVVKSKITPVAGGVEVKTKPAGKDAPVLYLTGDVIMGGVEIKHL